MSSKAVVSSSDIADIVEAPLRVQEHLVVDLEKVVVPEEVDVEGRQWLDFGSHRTLVSTERVYNDLGQRIKMDNTRRVSDNSSLVNVFNGYDSKGSTGAKIGGYVLAGATMGCYAMARRTTVPPGSFGHYISSARHKLLLPGIHTLTGLRTRFIELVPIDDEEHPNRQYGDKSIVQVSENCIAGAYRVGVGAADNEDDVADQEFLLLGQGRHVLCDSEFYGVEVKKLEGNLVKLGPLTVVYVAEGFLGTCRSKKTGVHQLLFPGPPYLLHEQNYTDIEVAERIAHPVTRTFELGNYICLTVPDGFLGGAWSKAGVFVRLPPGRTYTLTRSEYSSVELKERSDNFNIGPYQYVTVRSGFYAGVERKREGDFVVLQPGKTYALNQELYHPAIVESAASDVVVLGPLTFLSVREGVLAGAVRRSDGVFVEFGATESDDPHVLHQEQYYDLVTIPKYTNQPQQFGPYTVLTVRAQDFVVISRSGEAFVADVGFHKLSSENKVAATFPRRTYTESPEGCQFLSRDGVRMMVRFSFSWAIDEPLQVYQLDGGVDVIRHTLLRRSADVMAKASRSHKRTDLLPTVSVEELQSELKAGKDAAAAMQAAEDSAHPERALYRAIESECLAALKAVAAASRFGVRVDALLIDRFELLDESLKREIEAITKHNLSSFAAESEGKFKATQARAHAEVLQVQARSEAEVEKVRAASEAEVVALTAKSRALAEVEAEKAAKLARHQLLESEAAAEAKAASIRAQMKIEQARAEAEAISLLAKANKEKALAEFEASSQISEKQLNLELMEKRVEMARALGAAAWRYPDQFQALLQDFQGELRLGTSTLSEILAQSGGSGASGASGGSGASPARSSRTGGRQSPRPPTLTTTASRA